MCCPRCYVSFHDLFQGRFCPVCLAVYRVTEPAKKRHRPAKTTATRQQVYERDGHRCVACGSEEDLTLDHRIPKCRGGTNALENLQTMCSPCNQSKGDMMPDEWEAARAL